MRNSVETVRCGGRVLTVVFLCGLLGAQTGTPGEPAPLQLPVAIETLTNAQAALLNARREVDAALVEVNSVLAALNGLRDHSDIVSLDRSKPSAPSSDGAERGATFQLLRQVWTGARALPETIRPLREGITSALQRGSLVLEQMSVSSARPAPSEPLASIATLETVALDLQLPDVVHPDSAQCRDGIKPTAEEGLEPPVYLARELSATAAEPEVNDIPVVSELEPASLDDQLLPVRGDVETSEDTLP